MQGSGGITVKEQGTDEQPVLDMVVRRLADRVGELIKFWGFSTHTGRVWALLYLTEEPLTATVIAARLGMSSGLLSQTLNELMRWGVIHRFKEPPCKAWRYAEDPDVWKSVTRVLRERERRMVEETVDLLDTLIQASKEQRGPGEGARADYLITRLAGLRTLAHAAMVFLDALLLSAFLDVKPLKHAMRLTQIRRKLPFL